MHELIVIASLGDPAELHFDSLVLARLASCSFSITALGAISQKGLAPQFERSLYTLYISLPVVLCPQADLHRPRDQHTFASCLVFRGALSVIPNWLTSK